MKSETYCQRLLDDRTIIWTELSHMLVDCKIPGFAQGSWHLHSIENPNAMMFLRLLSTK